MAERILHVSIVQKHDIKSNWSLIDFMQEILFKLENLVVGEMIQ